MTVDRRDRSSRGQKSSQQCTFALFSPLLPHCCLHHALVLSSLSTCRLCAAASVYTLSLSACVSVLIVSCLVSCV